jgi:hypothetical protein
MTEAFHRFLSIHLIFNRVTICKAHKCAINHNVWQKQQAVNPFCLPLGLTKFTGSFPVVVK